MTDVMAMEETETGEMVMEEVTNYMIMIGFTSFR